MATIVVALLLCSVGGLVSIHEGWHKLHAPEPLNNVWVALCVLAVAIVLGEDIAARVRTLLIGKSAEPELERSIRDLINRDPAIDELLNTITLQMGPKVLLAAKVKMRPGLSIEDAVAHMNELEAEIKRLHPEVGWSFVEPDVTD